MLVDERDAATLVAREEVDRVVHVLVRFVLEVRDVVKRVRVDAAAVLHDVGVEYGRPARVLKVAAIVAVEAVTGFASSRTPRAGADHRRRRDVEHAAAERPEHDVAGRDEPIRDLAILAERLFVVGVQALAAVRHHDRLEVRARGRCDDPALQPAVAEQVAAQVAVREVIAGAPVGDLMDVPSGERARVGGLGVSEGHGSHDEGQEEFLGHAVPTNGPPDLPGFQCWV